MKRLRVMVAVVVGLSCAAAVLAADIPWKAEKGAKESAAAASVDLKAELPPAQYNRIVKPIEAKLDAAQKYMTTYDKEMAKAAEKRNERLLVNCRTRAAENYLGAATAAKRGINMVKNETHKAAIKQQFEEPNRNKAIDMFLELATSAHARGDIRMAVAYYKRILAVDKENAEAKEGLVKIAQALKEAAQAGKRSGSRTSGGDDRRSWDREDYKRSGRDDGEWSKTGRTGW